MLRKLAGRVEQRQKSRRLSGRAIGLLLGCLLSSGCDGAVGMHGKAYRWVNPPPSVHGAVGIDDPKFRLPRQIAPLEGVDLTIYHSPEYAFRTDETALLWRTVAQSGVDGSFEDGGTCAPGSYDMALGVVKEGCEPIFRVFHHDGKESDHELVILLVCRNLPLAGKGGRNPQTIRRERVSPVVPFRLRRDAHQGSSPPS
jgi:hypothetical protein